ncbi:MAG: 4-alpha-glucanotransferase [Planctomycetaceae bacterium]|nr:4-alpha-glucanotransferase [Planctomycetaceae bacterium]
MDFPRSGGLLLPIFSLPGSSAIGNIGPPARRFVDFLAATGQSVWQLLPLGPPARGNSPYSCWSAFAGNPLFISPEDLVDAGLLTADETAHLTAGQPSSQIVDYDLALTQKVPLLRAAWQRFRKVQPGHLVAEQQRFRDEHRSWLHDFARFDVLEDRFGDPDWLQWPADLRSRLPDALAECDRQFADEIDFSVFTQFLFYRQWAGLKQYAADRRVRLYGDMPIFVAHESADVWTHQDLFQLDESGVSTVVAGVPPDYFSATGQKWGNPLYRWDRIAETGFDWWNRRFRNALELYDLLRIDHFRGFESYWEIPADAEDATSGHWRSGPGTAPFDAARAACGPLPIVAEDLGLITDEVHALRERLEFPGMRVLQFGFGSAEDNYHRPEAYPVNSVAYTGTHDNDTIMSWYGAMSKDGWAGELLRHYVSQDSVTPHLDLIRSVMHSASHTVVVPVQDLLGLGAEARMNTPGEPKGNWVWRCPEGMYTDSVADVLRSMTAESHRIQL